MLHQQLLRRFSLGATLNPRILNKFLGIDALLASIKKAEPIDEFVDLNPLVPEVTYSTPITFYNPGYVDSALARAC